MDQDQARRVRATRQLRGVIEAIAAGDAPSARQSVLSHLDVVWYRMTVVGAGIPVPRDPLAAARAYLDLHMQQPLRLGEVARLVCRTSASHLARLFRQQVGMSFTAYLREIRLARAAALLESSSAEIRDIAKRVGYRDPSRFAQHFRARFGTTPRDYRRDQAPRQQHRNGPRH